MAKERTFRSQGFQGGPVLAHPDYGALAHADQADEGLVQGRQARGGFRASAAPQGAGGRGEPRFESRGVGGPGVRGDRASDTQFRSKVNELLSATPPRLAIVLEHVTQVDTSGLTALVTAHLTAAKRGGALKLVKPTARIRELLHITRLDTLFEMFDSEEDALATFRT